MNSGQSGRSIGLFGGSFDPPHRGHLALVQAGLDLGLDAVWVIPALPVHRQLSGCADGYTRFDWLTQMFAGQPSVQVIDWEISSGQPMPAIETLRRFHQMFPDTVPWLMMGADVWRGLPGWREYPMHRALCNVAVFSRCETASETVCGHAGWRQLAADRIQDSQGAGHWIYAPAALPDISATALRNDAIQGKLLSGRVVEVVRTQIECAYGRSKENM